MSLIFSNPFFLYLLPVATLPIILHLISRGKPIKLFFPSIRFIKLGKVPSHEKQTLTDILLLILRILLLLALVLFFADPKIKNDTQQLERSKCVIIIDTSISAFHQNYFAAISEKLKTEINQFNNQSDFFIINSAHKIMDTLKTKNKTEALNFVSKLTPSHISPNHRQALQEASAFIGQSKGTLIMASLFDTSGFEQLNNINLKIGTEIKYVNTDISRSNISILGAQFTKNDSDINTVRLTAKLLNEGLSNFTGELKLSFSGKTESKTLQLMPNQTGTIVFNVDIPPNSNIALAIENDDFAPDNVYFCKSPQTPVVDFLLIKPAKPQNSEAIFIEETLRISNINMTQVNFQVVNHDQFNSSLPKPPHYIMLSACADLLTSEQLITIRDWHKLGTHLIITPSEEYRKCFSVLSNSGIITQTAISKFTKGISSGPVFFNNINETSPYTNIFTKNGVNDFISIPIHQYIRLFHLKNTEILLNTENDDPILLLNRLGSGTSFVFTINLDPTWSDLPLTSIFLPLVRQLINISFQNNAQKSQEYVLPGIYVKTTPNDNIYFLNNEQKGIPEKELGKLIELDSPGIYQFSSQTYIVNNSRKHSKPDIISEFEFKNALLTQNNKNAIEEASNPENDSLKNYLLYLILLLIFLEIFFHSENKNRKREVLA